jgi:hypothetical protein
LNPFRRIAIDGRSRQDRSRQSQPRFWQKKTNVSVRASSVQNHPTTRNADPKNGPELIRLLRKQRINSSNEEYPRR